MTNSEKISFLKFCIVMAALLVAVLTWMFYASKSTRTEALQQFVKQVESTQETELGNQITRTFDSMYNVVCYNRASGQFSCVYLVRDK